MKQLSPEEHAELARLHAIVLENEPLVHLTIRRYLKMTPGMRDYHDFVQIGMMVLQDSARSWRVDGGCTWASYVVKNIRRRLFRELHKSAMRGMTPTTTCKTDVQCAPVVDVMDERQSPSSDDELSDDIQSLLRQLPQREQLIIKERFLNGRSLRDVGSSLGMCRERVRQIQDRALSALWKRLEA